MPWQKASAMCQIEYIYGPWQRASDICQIEFDELILTFKAVKVSLLNRHDEDLRMIWSLGS